MLVWRDGHNLVERFFTPQEEFLYFDSPDDFEGILKDVLAHPTKYEPIAKQASPHPSLICAQAPSTTVAGVHCRTFHHSSFGVHPSACVHTHTPD